jgi:Ca2+-binding EF-hand superfamily protein
MYMPFEKPRRCEWHGFACRSFLFDVFDYNMNGQLDRNELEAMLELVRPDKVGFKKEEIDKLVDEVDPNGQRQHISFDAFMAYCKRQPGINEMLTLDPAILGA